MPFTYSATINDVNDEIPAKISDAVASATAPLSTKAQNLRTEIDALKARVSALENNTSEPTPEPTPTPTYTPNNSGGSGALPGNYRALSHTATTATSGSVSSYYHLDTTHVDWTKPAGILFHLHGDGAGEYNNPDGSIASAYRQIAVDNNMVFVLPKTPDTTGSLTWWEDTKSEEFLIALFNHVAKVRHNVDLNRVYWSGYSGGAEVLTYDILAKYNDQWTGGGAQMLGGGGAYSSLAVKAPSTSLKAHFPLQWVVGSNDDGSTSTDGFDAISAANSGKQRYANAGFTTSLVTIQGDDHYQSQDNGPIELRKFITNTIWK